MSDIQHVTKISDLSREKIEKILDVSRDMKANPKKYGQTLNQRTLLMLFEKPSLRTRVSFETGMTQLGGHAIFYSIADSPLGKKESISDTGKVLSRYCDVIMARVKSRKDIAELANSSTIPVINALDDFCHPCQMLADLLTIMEKKGSFKGLKMAYVGDCHNNVTYGLLRSACIMGFHINVAGPDKEGMEVEEEVVKECELLCEEYGGSFKILHDAVEAVTDVDVIYTDSWMSYGIPKELEESREELFRPFQVNSDLLKHAKSDVIFMNCLPAMRGKEQTSEVIDGSRSVVFDQAENRLHTEKALMLFLVESMVKKTAKKKKGRLVVALGGNALQKPKEKGTWKEMYANADITSEQLTSLIEDGWNLVVTHGNGPQVGSIYLQNQIASDTVSAMPLNVCGAESQGELGYLIAQSMNNTLLKKGIAQPVAAVVTQTQVDKNDSAFQNPTKPVGKFYTAEDAEVLKRQGYTVKEDAGRGYRVVVPSPMPMSIVEGETITALVNSGCVVVASGGGGIPVVRDEAGTLRGIDAVIDKDLAAQLLASYVSADCLMILTDVEHAYVDYRKETQRPLKQVHLSEAEKFIEEGQFSSGSMLPKMKAACMFVKRTGRNAIVTSLDKAVQAIEGFTGTHIVPDPQVKPE